MTENSVETEQRSLPPVGAPIEVGNPPAPKFRIIGDRATLFAAMAKARAAFGELQTSRTAEVRGETKTGKPFNYEFDYADLPTLQAATVPGLHANGLNIFQTYWDEGDGHVLLTALTHDSGASIEVEVYVPPQDNVQKMQSALTYHKRYQWGGLCGIAAKRDDDDGNEAAGNRSDIKDRFPKTPQVPQGRPKPAPAAQPKAEPQTAPQSQPEAKAEHAPTEPPDYIGQTTYAADLPLITLPTLEKVRELAKVKGLGKQSATQFILEQFSKSSPNELTEAEGLRLVKLWSSP